MLRHCLIILSEKSVVFNLKNVKIILTKEKKIYKIFVLESEIPDDIEDFLSENDIIFYNIDGKFDLAMLERGFFEFGTIRRSHRIVTEKFKSLSIEEIYTSLIGK